MADLEKQCLGLQMQMAQLHNMLFRLMMHLTRTSKPDDAFRGFNAHKP
jgi:hypothetical protein